MPRAYVFIKTEKGFAKNILNKLKKLHAIKEAYLINGVYDIIVKMNFNSIGELRETIAWNIRLQNKVISTLTMTIIEKIPSELYLEREVNNIPANIFARN